MKNLNPAIKSKPLVMCLFLLFNLIANTQSFKKEKRIFLLDITKSMWGLNESTPDIFNEVKTKLFEGIEGITNPETEIMVIPFQGTTTYEKFNLPSWTFTISDKKIINELKKTINSYNLKTVPGNNTDIYSAIVKGQEVINTERKNYIYLLTDGKQSSKGGSVKFDNKDRLDLLNDWCNWAEPRDVNLFYVMLTEASKDDKLIEIVKKQCNIHITTGTDMNFGEISPTSEKLMINLHDEPTNLIIDLSANNWSYISNEAALKVSLDSNNLFKFKEPISKISDKKLSLELEIVDNQNFNSLRENNPQEISINLSITSDKDNLKVINPNLKLIVKNKKEKKLILEFENE